MVMFPLASGELAVGCTWMPLNASWHVVAGLPPFWSAAVTVSVMVVEVTTGALTVKQVLVPARRVMLALTTAAVLKTKPVGTLRTTVFPATKLPVCTSTIVGPLSVVQAVVS